MQFTRWLTAAIAAGVVVSYASAAEPPRPLLAPHEDKLKEDASLSLRDVVLQTLQRNPSPAVIDARVQETDALKAQAGSLIAGAPAVSLRYQTDEVGSNDGLQEWETGLELPLWLFGQKGARRAVAEQAYAELSASQRALLLDVAGKVREALWDVELAQNRVALAEQERHTAQTLEQDVQKRVRLGELPRVDLILAQDETLARRTDYLRMATELRHAQQSYRSLTGLDQVPTQRTETPTDKTAITEDHPLLAKAQGAVAVALARRDLARVERRENPTVLVGTRHEKEQSGEDFANSVGVILRLPLGSKAHSAPKMATAEVVIAEAKRDRDLMKRELERNLHEAIHNIEASGAELEAAAERHELALENLRLINTAFAVGETDLVGLLRIQARAFAAERNFVLRRLELQRDIARFNQAAGVLL